MSIADTRDSRNSTLRVVLIVGALIVIRLIAAALATPGKDELYYILWSRFPAWSYYDHPPMSAWWIAASSALFGDSPLGLRAFMILSAIPTTLAIYATGRVLFDRATGERAALWLNATLLVGVGSLAATPDAPAVLFWALATLALVLALTSRHGWWWLVVGVFAALGVASKLTDLFLGLGIVLCLIVDRDRRRWLASPWPWLGGLAAVIVFAPILVWNASHDWITFTMQFKRLAAHVFTPLKLPELIAEQFALLNPLIAIFAGLGVYVWLARRTSYPIRGIGLLTWTILPLVVYMLVHALHQPVQPHWLAPMYPTVALIAAAAAEMAPARRWGAGRALAFPVGVVLSLIGLVGAINPGNLIPVHQDAARSARGWEQLALDADALRQSVHAQWIATTYYGVDSALVYYLRHTSTSVLAVAERERYAFLPPPDRGFVDRAVLIVSKDTDPAHFARCFDNVERVGTLQRKSGDETVETFAAFRADRALPAAIDPGCDAIAP